MQLLLSHMFLSFMARTSPSNSTKRGAFFRHFCVSKVITTAHAHKSGFIFHFFEELSNKVLRADGRLVNMSGVFCTNNAQAPSLFSNVTLTSRRSYVETVSGNSALLQSNGIKWYKWYGLLYHLTEEGHCCPKQFQHTIVCLLVLRWKRGRELVHCLYKKLQTSFQTKKN